MKTQLFIILSSLILTTSAAEYGLEDILDQASRHADDLKIAQLRYDEGVQQMRFYRAEAMPYVKFSTGASYASTSLKAQLDAMGLGGGGGSTNMPDPTGVDASVLRYLGELMAGLTSAEERSEGMTYSWNVTAVQPLITFGKVRSALHAAKVRGEMLERKLQLDRDLYYLNVISAFSVALAAQQEYEVLTKSLDRAERLLAFTKSNLDAGLASEVDYLRLEGYAHGEEAGLLNTKVMRNAALERLSLLTEIPDLKGATLVVRDESSVLEAPAEETAGRSLQTEMGDYLVELKHSETKYERSKLFPSVNLVVGASNQFTAEDDNDLGPAQLFEGDYVSAHVGLQLSWTAFDGFRTPANYRQVKAQYARQQIVQRQAIEDAAIATDEAWEMIRVLGLTRQAREKQKTAAEKALSKTEIDFESGIADVTSLLDVQKQYRAAEKAVNDVRIQQILAVANLRIKLGEPLWGEAK